jgi:tRNA modification GTPase
LKVRTKADLLSAAGGADTDNSDDEIDISIKTGSGLDALMSELVRFGTVSNGQGGDSADNPLITRTRHRLALETCVSALESAGDDMLPLEIRVEFLRTASDSLGQILGRIDVEDILGHIFSEFCIGK